MGDSMDDQYAYGIGVGSAIAFLISACLMYMLNHVAYLDGVKDGYGYAKDPCNKQYAEAGDYLKRFVKHPHEEVDS